MENKKEGFRSAYLSALEEQESIHSRGEAESGYSRPPLTHLTQAPRPSVGDLRCPLASGALAGVSGTPHSSEASGGASGYSRGESERGHPASTEQGLESGVDSSTDPSLVPSLVRARERESVHPRLLPLRREGGGASESVFSDPTSEPYLLRKKLDLFIQERIFLFSYEEVEKLMCPALYLWDSGQTLRKGSKFWVSALREGYMDVCEWCLKVYKVRSDILEIPCLLKCLEEDNVDAVKHIVESELRPYLAYGSKESLAVFLLGKGYSKSFMYCVRKLGIVLKEPPRRKIWGDYDVYSYLTYETQLNFELQIVENFPVEHLRYLQEKNRVSLNYIHFVALNRVELIPVFRDMYIQNFPKGGTFFSEGAFRILCGSTFEYFSAFMSDPELQDTVAPCVPGYVSDMRIIKAVKYLGISIRANVLNNILGNIVFRSEAVDTSEYLEEVTDFDASALLVYVRYAKFPLLKRYLESMPGSTLGTSQVSMRYPTLLMLEILEKHLSTQEVRTLIRNSLGSLGKDISLIKYVLRKDYVAYFEILSYAVETGSKDLIEYLLESARQASPNPLLDTLEDSYRNNVYIEAFKRKDIRLCKRFLAYGILLDVPSLVKYILEENDCEALDFLLSIQDIRWEDELHTWIEKNKEILRTASKVLKIYTEEELKFLLKK